MRRPIDIAVNFAVNGLAFYLIGRKLRDHRTGMLLGIIGGFIGIMGFFIRDSTADTAGE
jgi:hypothetical protein